MAAKLVNVNLSDLAHRRIKKMISEHRFSPGSRLNVERLARGLGASRTPIWEAVRKLEQEGLLRNVPNRHKISRIVDLVERLSVMHEGRIIAEGDPREVLRDPLVRQVYWGRA